MERRVRHHNCYVTWLPSPYKAPRYHDDNRNEREEPDSHERLLDHVLGKDLPDAEHGECGKERYDADKHKPDGVLEGFHTDEFSTLRMILRAKSPREASRSLVVL